MVSSPNGLSVEIGRRCEVVARNRQDSLAVGRVSTISPNANGGITILVEPESGDGPLDENMPNGMLLIEGSSMDTLYLRQRTEARTNRETEVRLLIR